MNSRKKILDFIIFQLMKFLEIFQLIQLKNLQKIQNTIHLHHIQQQKRVQICWFMLGIKVMDYQFL
jgi:hypothetical protein